MKEAWRALVAWWKGLPDEFRELVAHPLTVAVVSFVLAGLIAWRVTERWQRWRQRREFQYRAMVKFAELSEEALRRVSELLISRGRVSSERHRELRREFINRKGPLLALDAEIFVAFPDARVVNELVYIKDLLRVLYSMATGPKIVTVEEFKPVQDAFTANRRVMITRMAREMRLLRRREARSVFRQLEPKAKLPAGVSIPKETDEIEDA